MHAEDIESEQVIDISSYKLINKKLSQFYAQNGLGKIWLYWLLSKNGN